MSTYSPLLIIPPSLPSLLVSQKDGHHGMALLYFTCPSLIHFSTRSLALSFLDIQNSHQRGVNSFRKVIYRFFLFILLHFLFSARSFAFMRLLRVVEV